MVLHHSLAHRFSTFFIIFFIPVQFILHPVLFTCSSLHLGHNFRVVVDKVVTCGVDTPLAGFVLMFGSYVLFNTSYLPAVGATLEYIQRY
jgi:hypothetical protein